MSSPPRQTGIHLFAGPGASARADSGILSRAHLEAKLERRIFLLFGAKSQLQRRAAGPTRKLIVRKAKAKAKGDWSLSQSYPRRYPAESNSFAAFGFGGVDENGRKRTKTTENGRKRNLGVLGGGPQTPQS